MKEKNNRSNKRQSQKRCWNNGTFEVSNQFLETLEMSFIYSEINLDLNWSEICVIVATNVAAQVVTFSITDTKLYVPVVTLSIQDNAKLLEQLKSGFKWTINCKEYQSKVSPERINI